MKLLITRLAKFQRASTRTWTVLSEGETTNHRVEPYAPISKTDLCHYGWNMQQLFGKSGPQAAFFLQSTFHHHFDGLQLKTIKGKLTNDPLKGIIKINKELSPNYRSRLERDKEDNLRQMTKELEDEQKQRRFEEGQEYFPKIEKKEIADTKPITPSTKISNPERTTNVSRKEEKRSINQNRNVDKTFKHNHYDEEYDDYDEWEDETDEPVDEEFLDEMFKRQALRTESIKPYSGDIL